MPRDMEAIRIVQVHAIKVRIAYQAKKMLFRTSDIGSTIGDNSNHPGQD